MEQTSTIFRTLDEISERKKAVRKELMVQRNAILEQAKELFSPQPKEEGINSFMQSFNKGLALYDGVMTGIKLMKKVRGFFTKRGRYQK